MAILVRIKELKKDGVQNYTYKGMRFRAGMGWYELPAGREGEALAEEMKTLRHDHLDPDSPLLFDVVTREQAQAIESKEKASIMQKAAAGEPIRAVPKVDNATPVAPEGARRKGKKSDDDLAAE